ncbi:hypothetical protein ACHAXR_008774, partial [Thalassiosira sp. AJA248-18]
PTTTPTISPSSSPTSSPTTSNPTTSPTPAPTIYVQALDCPPTTGPMVTITSGLKTLTSAAPNTFCGIFLHKQESGDLIPLARSYHGQAWEAAPGPLACPSEDVNATSISLPTLTSDTYVILSKDGSMDTRKQIAKFLEMTTFGPTLSEIDGLASTTWNGAARANYIRNQMDLPATSHREYWRKRTNSKWDATAMPARSDHPCSPNSKWRKYSFTRQDRYDTITSTYIYTYYEVVPEEANLTYTLHEADSVSDVKSYSSGTFTSSNTGFSGTGYFDFGGTGAHLEFSVDIAEAGTYPISFRFAMSSSSFSGNRPCKLFVNDTEIVAKYDFIHTDSWSYWKYSDLVDVELGAGNNTIKLLVADQNGGPNIDHLRVGKPPAIVMKSNGWPRAIAKNGIHLLDGWPYDFTDYANSTFSYYPEPPMGDLYRYHYGRLRVNLPDGTGSTIAKFLDIGNPPLDFTGYEQYLPPNVFNFTENDIFVDTSSKLNDYPMRRGQELLLTTGSTDPVCSSVPPFSEESDAPIIGILPNGEWIQWTPTIIFEDNGPSINVAPEDDMTTNVLSDGGGDLFVQTNEKLKCSNVQRSFVNEGTCFLSTESTACSATDPVGEVQIPMNTSNVIAFYDLADKYVYAVRGLVMEELNEHACQKSISRWTFEVNTTCAAPTSLEADTTEALRNAIEYATSDNEYVKDVSRGLACSPTDVTTEKIDIEIQVGSDCYTHVHPDHLNVYDFSGWVTNHPGGEYNIQKWAQGWEGTEGWYLDFPFNGNTTRKIPKHQMSRWYNNVGIPNIVYVSKLGDSIAYRDLPNDLKTDSIAEYFGATPVQNVIDGGIIVCGSIGEVGNDPTLEETFDVRSNEFTTSSPFEQNNQKQVVWTEIAIYKEDQLRQRMAWALAQIVTTVPGNIDAFDRTEVYTHYYDIFVKHAFGNYRNILAEASYSPLMAEHLSYLKGKSHSYVYEDEDKRISRADENYAREIMQLFSIGLIALNDDGTPVIDPATGNPRETYTNEDIESFARAWTGFDRTAARGNYEEVRTGTSDNRLDPMRIIPEWRDPFPKPNLNGGFIGDGYLLCKDLPAQSFLKKGAGYRLLGSKASPELMKDTEWERYGVNDILRAELDANSALYQRLYNGGNYEVFVELENDLTCTTGTFECDVDTLRLVKLGPVYYEFVERPCVQMAFFDNGKQIQLHSNTMRGQMCANADLAHAREACCREDRLYEVRTAWKESNVTYLYEGERMTWATAQDRCVAYGKDLCLYENLSTAPDNNYKREGYQWTNKDCGINVKVNSEGYIAIVHDAMSTYADSIPWLVEEENTLNWFRVFWDSGSYPGDSETNTCADNNCKTLTDGSCLCKTAVEESVVFTHDSVSKEDVISQLFMGVLGPPDGSNATVIANDLTVHTIGDNVDASTVFEVEDKGRTLFFKNVLSTVSLEGWETLPEIYEAEDATMNNAVVKNNTSSATGGLYVEARNGNETSYVEWNVDVDVTGPYLISLRYANDNSPRPLSVFVNTQEVFLPLADPNNTTDFTNVGSNPSGDDLPLQRCGGDCDTDDHCGDGLFCMFHEGWEA